MAAGHDEHDLRVLSFLEGVQKRIWYIVMGSSVSAVGLGFSFCSSDAPDALLVQIGQGFHFAKDLFLAKEAWQRLVGPS